MTFIIQATWVRRSYDALPECGYLCPRQTHGVQVHCRLRQAGGCLSLVCCQAIRKKEGHKLEQLDRNNWAKQRLLPVVGRALVVIALGLLVFNMLMMRNAWAVSPQPIMHSPLCSTGGAEGEAFFLEALRYESAAEGIGPDFFMAERLFEKALKKGNAKAALYLGRMYRIVFYKMPAYGPRMQFQIALFERAIEMGCPDGYLFLAEVHQNGWGVRADPALAWKLVRQAADKGSVSAMTEWGTNLYFENRFDNDPQAQAKRREAKAWLERALKSGDGAAGVQLANIYRIYEPDPARAIWALREGAKRGNVNSLLMLAKIYRFGEDGQPKDPEYAAVADKLRRQIDVSIPPKPIENFLQWLPPRRAVSIQ